MKLLLKNGRKFTTILRLVSFKFCQNGIDLKSELIM